MIRDVSRWGTLTHTSCPAHVGSMTKSVIIVGLREVMAGLYHGVSLSKRHEVLTVIPLIELTWEEGEKKTA